MQEHFEKLMKKKSLCDKVSFEEVYNKLFDTICNFMYYRYGDLEVSEDITQEIFMKLWERCNEVSFSKVKSYLFTAARNTMLNRLKHQKVVLNFQKISTTKKDYEDPEFILESHEFEKQLKNAINNLPTKQRETFLLSRLDKKTYNEIAQLSGVSVKAIEKRMSEALVSLREQLGNVL